MPAVALAVAAGVALTAAWLFLHTRHFTASEVDVKPRPLRGVDLPPPVDRNGIEYYGKLRLDIYLASDGTVERIDTGQSTVPEALRQEAVRAFSGVGWDPARKWGVRVASVKRVEVDFEPPVRGLRNANVSPAVQ